MAISFTDAALFALAPAALGYVVSLVLSATALRDAFAAEGETPKKLALLAAAIPASAPVLAFVAATLANGAPDDLRLPLALVGIAAFAQCVVQGWLARTSLPAAVREPAQLGRMILALALPEVLTVLAFGFLMLRIGAGT